MLQRLLLISSKESYLNEMRQKCEQQNHLPNVKPLTYNSSWQIRGQTIALI